MNKTVYLILLKHHAGHENVLLNV